MGSKYSKSKKNDNTTYDPDSPNVTHMSVCGESSVIPVPIWVKEFGFPKSGNVSTRQLNQLREKMEKKEAETKDKTGKSKFRGDWKASGLWMEDANRRERKSQVDGSCYYILHIYHNCEVCDPP